MIFHESGDEIIAVVVTAVLAQRQRNAGLRACALQQFGAKLFGEERIGIAAIDQQIGKPRAILDQRHRIVLAPASAILAEIAAERLDAHGTCEGATIGENALAAR